MNISSPSSYIQVVNPAAQPGSPVAPDSSPPARRQAVPEVEEAKRGEGSKDRVDVANKQAEKEAQTRDRVEQAQALKDTEVISKLKARDREVRAHEAAHAAVGGQYAGAPTYTYQRGPNGVNYAVGGEVSISTSEVAGDPEATLQKALQVQRAALAPAEPSAQDRKVAAQASQMAAQARIDIAAQLQSEQAETRAAASASAEIASSDEAENNKFQATSGPEPGEVTPDAAPSAPPETNVTELTGLASPRVNVASLLADAGVREPEQPRPGSLVSQRA